MGAARGSKGGHVAFGVNTSGWGTFDTPNRFVKIEGDDVEENRPLNEDPDIIHRGIHVDSVYQAGRSIEGGFTFKARTEGWLLLLQYLLGKAVATTTPDPTNAPTARQHVFEVDDLPANGLSFEVDRDLYALRGASVHIASMGFTIEAPGMLKVNPTIFGYLDATPHDVPTGPTFSTSTRWIFSHAAVEWNEVSQKCTVTNWSVDNALEGLDDVLNLGSQDPLEPVRGDAYTVNGDFTTWFEDLTILDDFKNAQSRKLYIIFTGASLGGAITELLRFEMEVAHLRTAENKAPGSGRILLPCSFSAYEDATYDSIKITAINTEETL